MLKIFYKMLKNRSKRPNQTGLSIKPLRGTGIRMGVLAKYDHYKSQVVGDSNVIRPSQI